VELQRARLLKATLEVLAAEGLRGITIDAVVKQARVSSVTFRELFGSIEQALVELMVEVTARSVNLVRDAFESEQSWGAGVLAGLEALLTFLDSEPLLARVCLVEALAGPSAAIERRAQLLEPLATLVDGAREMLPTDKQPPEATAEAAIALVAGVLHTRLVTGQAPPFIDFLGELAALVIAPYLGLIEAAEAARTGDEHSKRIARERAARSPDLRVPVPMRLLHGNATRARACIRYVAEHPGASNKKIATGIGMSHLGQISKLLADLASDGVLTKQPGAAGRPNAWTISWQGEQVLQALGGY
jgi:AcrR family transcriptional regulator